MNESEATIIDISGLEIVNPIHGSTSFILNPELHTIDYPFGGAFEHNLHIVHKMIETFLKVKHEHFKFRHRIHLFCRGNSGSTIATIFAVELLKHNLQSRIVYIPKKGEKRHSGMNFTQDSHDLYVIVDDFVCSGETINEIYKGIKDYLPTDHKCIDILCVSGYMGRRDCDFPVKYAICKELT